MTRHLPLVTRHSSLVIFSLQARTGPSSGSTNGLASSLAFTPVQGIELVNPTANKDAKEGTETYFSQTAQFFQSAFS